MFNNRFGEVFLLSSNKNKTSYTDYGVKYTYLTGQISNSATINRLVSVIFVSYNIFTHLIKVKKKNKNISILIYNNRNVDSEQNFNDLLDSLNAVAEKYKFPIIVSTHPRTRLKLENLKRADMNPLIQFLKPLGFFDYNRLQLNAFCVISDSGTITEESSILNFPAITIRQAHERPEGMDEGTVIMTGLKKERKNFTINRHRGFAICLCKETNHPGSRL